MNGLNGNNLPNNHNAFVIVDAMAMAFRYFYALIRRPMRTSYGLNTSAVYGFTNMLLDILSKYNPRYIAIAFDSEEETLRKKEFDYYKAQRPPMPEELSKNIPYIKKMISVLGIKCIEMPGYEADDIIGFISQKAAEHNIYSYIVTSDKDMGQLVNDKIFILKPGKNNEPDEILGVKEICEKWSISQPQQLIDILAIMGDASDNIPGVPGIGEKGAIKLISQFHSVENLLENLDEVPEKYRDLISKNIELLKDSKRLASINPHINIDFDPKDFEWKIPPKEHIFALCDELEFRNIKTRIPEIFKQLSSIYPTISSGQLSIFDNSNETPLYQNDNRLTKYNPKEQNYKLLINEAEIKEFIDKLSKVDFFVFDLETTSLDPIVADLVGISFALSPYNAVFIYCKQQNICRLTLDLLKPIFENEKIAKGGFNLKFDISILKHYNINVSGEIRDAMVAHYILNPEGKHNMDYLADIYLEYKTITFSELVNDKKDFNLWNIDTKQLSVYACEDSDITLQLWNIFEQELKEKKQYELYINIESKLIPVLSTMELNGVKIDLDFLKKFELELQNQIDKLANEIYEISGEVFNIASPQQLGKILFEKLNISDKPKLTKTKQYSTSEDELLKYQNQHPIINKILDYRELTKLLNTYVSAFPKLVHPITGKVHTNFNQTITSTGRLSSSNPNLQNIPVRTDLGKEMRKAFIPSNIEGFIVSADYNQIELRLMAALSEDENMIQDFIKGMDIHAATAMRIFNLTEDTLTPEFRRKAKAINFGIIYGISAFGLSEQLGISRSEAKQIIEDYFTKYPGIKKYMDESINFAKEHGYVETLFHRRRYLPEIKAANAVVRGYAERNAINMPIQGTAADIIKIAMIRVQELIDKNHFLSKLIIQVHDELVLDVVKEELDIIKNEVKGIMENVIHMNVPLKVDIGHGENWLEAH